MQHHPGLHCCHGNTRVFGLSDSGSRWNSSHLGCRATPCSPTPCEYPLWAFNLSLDEWITHGDDKKSGCACFASKVIREVRTHLEAALIDCRRIRTKLTLTTMLRRVKVAQSEHSLIQGDVEPHNPYYPLVRPLLPSPTT